MKLPFGKLMELVAAIPDDDYVTFGELADRWDEPVPRIMDASDAVRIMNGGLPYIATEEV